MSHGRWCDARRRRTVTVAPNLRFFRLTLSVHSDGDVIVSYNAINGNSLTGLAINDNQKSAANAITTIS